MALLIGCSFDVDQTGYHPEEYGIFYGYANGFSNISSGRTGDGLQVVSLTPHDDRKYFAGGFAAINEGFVQVCMRTTRTGNDSNWWFTVYLGTTLLLSILWKTDRYLHVYRGDGKAGGTLLGTSSAQVPNDDVWHVYEFHIKIDSSNGIFHIKMDGITILNFNGNTQDGADTTFDSVRIHNNGGSGAVYDDFIVHDTTGPYNDSWPDGARCQFIKPNGTGGVTQWTPSAGANYQCVDEDTANTSDWVATNADAQVDTYLLQNLDAAAVTVKAVIPHLHGWREGNPAPTKISRVLRKGGNNYESAAQVVPAVTLGMLAWEILETDPVTGIPFTVDDINNNIELGIKSVV